MLGKELIKEREDPPAEEIEELLSGQIQSDASDERSGDCFRSEQNKLQVEEVKLNF